MFWSRFDRSRLQAVPPEAVSARRCARTDALLAACREGAGPATRPLLRPWARPRIERPFALLHVDDAELARRACLQLDGSWWMQDAPGLPARLAIRWRALWADAIWWRPLRDADAWDAGVAHSAAALQGFTPRRATLLVVEGEPDAAGREALASLARRAGELRRAVRVLQVPAAGPHMPA